MQNKGYISRMVYYILRSDAEARDNWLIVVKKVHDTEMITMRIEITEYYHALFSERLTNPQTISRIWRKIQEHNPELRGKEWEQRQKQSGQISQEIVKGEGGWTQNRLF